MSYLVVKLLDPRSQLPVAEFPSEQEAEKDAKERNNKKDGDIYMVISMAAYKTKFGRWSEN